MKINNKEFFHIHNQSYWSEWKWETGQVGDIKVMQELV